MEKKPLFEIEKSNGSKSQDTLTVKLSEAVGSAHAERTIHDLCAALTAVRLTLVGSPLPDNATEREMRKMAQMSNHIKTLEHAIAELVKLLSGGEIR